MSSGVSGNRFLQFMAILGPGLLYAGAAVGVSHLVQSTRAGAQFGFYLLWAVILANLVKYPFFEFGPRYAAATGHSLLEGYQKLGRWGLWVFILLTLSTMFTIQSAVTVVTAAIVANVTGLNLPLWEISAGLLFVSLLILILGRYAFLDRFMKWVIVLLAVATIAALVSALFVAPVENPASMPGFNWGDPLHIFFLIALIGWMPAPIDIAAWHSVWAVARQRESGRHFSFSHALLDFKVGYWGTAFLAVCFLSLGALVMHHSGREFSNKGGVFAGQVIELYTTSIGAWSFPLIAFAAFTTMFSTTVTCLDAFPRVLGMATHLLFPKRLGVEKGPASYFFWICITAIGTVLVLALFMKNMKSMVDLATTLSFVTAPLLALMNYLVLKRAGLPRETRPPQWLWRWAQLGILVLFGFCAWFLWVRFAGG